MICKFKAVYKYILFLFAVQSMSGCAYLGSYIQDVNFISVSQETDIGQKMSVEVAKQLTIVNNPALSWHINQIGQRLVSGLPRRDFNYDFQVVQDASPNAFTIPGGHIYIHTGLFKLTSNDDEVAGVIAHEIGHAYARHPAKSLSRQYGADFLSNLVLKQNKNQLANLALQMTKGGILLKYGREDELEADQIGYELLGKTGFDPDGLIRFFQKMEKISQSQPIAFLSDHPATPERIKRLQMLKNSQGGAFSAGSAKLLT